MGQGLNRENVESIMDLNPEDLLEFYLIYYNFPRDNFNFLAICPSFNRTDYAEGTTNGGSAISAAPHIQQVIWQKQQYIAVAMEGNGFTVQADNELPRPRIKISNRDFFISKYLSTYGDMIGAKVVRKRVFARFLDNANFLPQGNPYGTANEDAGFPDEVFFINRKTSENKSFIEFELATSLELENIKIPNRIGLCRHCYWNYRGYGCGYEGVPKTDKDGNDLTLKTTQPNKDKWSETGVSYAVGEYVFLENETYAIRAEDEVDIINGPSIKPLRTYYVCKEAHTSSENERPTESNKWTEDVCQKTIKACSKRYGNNLPFGGFPGTYEYNSQY